MQTTSYSPAQLTSDKGRKRALDRAMDEALKKPGQRRKRAGDIVRIDHWAFAFIP